MSRILLMNKGEQSEFHFEADNDLSLNTKSNSLEDQDDLITSEFDVQKAEALNASEISSEPTLPPVLRKLSFEPNASDIEIARNELQLKGTLKELF